MSVYEQVRRANTNSEFRRVRIVEVNPANRYVLARDFYDRDYQISFDFHGSVVHIPMKDEIWLIKSYQTEWRLDRKLEANAIEELAPGDKALKADGSLYLEGSEVLINGRNASELITAEDLPAALPVVTEVAKDGTLVATRKRINLITGANTTLTVADNPASDRIDVTVAALAKVQSYAMVTYQLASGNAGGSSVAATWTTRPINTEVIDTDGILSLSANQIVLSAGTYRCHISGEFYSTGARFKMRLRNITDSTTLLVGDNGFVSDGGGTGGKAIIRGQFTVAAGKQLAVQYYKQNAQATNGLGVESTSGEVEVYLIGEFWKL